jgi:hypothetical protein
MTIKTTTKTVRTEPVWADPTTDDLTAIELESLWADVHDDEQAMSYPNEWLTKRFGARD